MRFQLARETKILLCGRPCVHSFVYVQLAFPEAWPWTTKGTYWWRTRATTAYRYSIRTRRSCAHSAAGDAATASSKGSRASPSCPTATYWCATARTTGCRFSRRRTAPPRVVVSFVVDFFCFLFFALPKKSKTTKQSSAERRVHNFCCFSLSYTRARVQYRN